MISYRNIGLQKANNHQEGKVKYIINGNMYSAEEAAINHYRRLGYNALWTENTYWWTLMYLFFWDVIFAKIKGSVRVLIDGVQTELEPRDERFDQIFKQTIQMNGIPSDFFTSEFYARRKSIIENRIRELQHSNLEQKLREFYKQNYGRNCRLIEDWDRYKIDELLISVQKVDREKLIKIFERLISNFNDNRAGLPDLIVYNDDDFFFSEVKTEKDKISEKQREWHDFLSITLDLKVEILLINHTETQIEKIKALYMPSSKEEVVISFGYSSSKKREDAIKFIQEQASYFTQGEGKEQIYGARFEINETDIEKLFTILDLTSGWKTQKIEIGGEIVKSTDLRNSLWCFREKTKQKASLDYCRKREYDNKPNKFGCRNIYFNELENEEWQDYGYIDTTKGEWIFDHKKINERIEEEIRKVKYCPLFDAKKIRNLIKKMPEKVNPKIDKNWAFISNDYDKWFWYQNRWINTLGETDFPGFNVMVGVEKLSRKEINEAIHYSKGEHLIGISYKGSSQKAKQKSGCFIATAVYSNSEAYQVRKLRYFRDNYLEKRIIGRQFINAYYKISPSIAEFIRKYRFLASLIRIALDVIVKGVEKYNSKVRTG
ncbi:MAG: CFI-box-CTERM domain-containing protein [Candidatus Heimdallarchaeaceae archaeon]